MCLATEILRGSLIAVVLHCEINIVHDVSGMRLFHEFIHYSSFSSTHLNSAKLRSVESSFSRTTKYSNITKVDNIETWPQWYAAINAGHFTHDIITILHNQKRKVGHSHKQYNV